MSTLVTIKRGTPASVALESKHAYQSCHFRGTSAGDKGHFGGVTGTRTKVRTPRDLHKCWSRHQ